MADYRRHAREKLVEICELLKGLNITQREAEGLIEFIKTRVRVSDGPFLMRTEWKSREEIEKIYPTD